MPNWCENRLEIQGNLEEIERFVQFTESKEDANLLLVFNKFRDKVPKSLSLDGWTYSAPLFPSLTGNFYSSDMTRSKIKKLMKQEKKKNKKRKRQRQEEKDKKAKIIYTYSSPWGPYTKFTEDASFSGIYIVLC
jgi:hypothetical protein